MSLSIYLIASHCSTTLLPGNSFVTREYQSLLHNLKHHCSCSSVNLHSRLSYLHHLAAPYVQTIDRLPKKLFRLCEPHGTSNTNTLQNFFSHQSRVKESTKHAQKLWKERDGSRQRSCVCKADPLTGCRYERADKRSGAAARGREREEEKMKNYHGNPVRAECWARHAEL